MNEVQNGDWSNVKQELQEEIKTLTNENEDLSKRLKEKTTWGEKRISQAVFDSEMKKHRD